MGFLTNPTIPMGTHFKDYINSTKNTKNLKIQNIVKLSTHLIDKFLPPKSGEQRRIELTTSEQAAYWL